MECLRYKSGRVLAVTEGKIILVGDFDAVIAKTNHVTGMDNVLVDLLVIEEEAVGTVHIFNIGSIEIGEYPRVVGADALISDADVVVCGPPQANGSQAEFQFVNILFVKLIFCRVHIVSFFLIFFILIKAELHKNVIGSLNKYVNNCYRF